MADTAVQAGAGGSINFEPLLVAHATGSWLLCQAPNLPEQQASCQQQPQLQLHVLYTTTPPSSASSSGGAWGTASAPIVVGVGKMVLPVIDTRLAAPWQGAPQQHCGSASAEKGCALQGWQPGALPSTLPSPLPPIHFEALQHCQLSCPSTGREVGSVSLAARLSIVPTYAASTPPRPAIPRADPGTCTAGQQQQQHRSCVGACSCRCGTAATITTTVQCGSFNSPSASGGASASSPAIAQKPERRHVDAQASPAKLAARATTAAQQGPYAMPAMPYTAYHPLLMPPPMGFPMTWGLPFASPQTAAPMVPQPVWQPGAAVPGVLPTAWPGAAPCLAPGPTAADLAHLAPHCTRLHQSQQPCGAEEEGCGQGTGAGLAAHRPPSRHACVQTSHEGFAEPPTLVTHCQQPKRVSALAHAPVLVRGYVLQHF
jgi:hypothetical protein